MINPISSLYIYSLDKSNPKTLDAGDKINRFFRSGSIDEIPAMPSLLDHLMQMNGVTPSYKIETAEKTVKCRRFACGRQTHKSQLDKRGYCPECAKVVRPYRSTGKRETK